MRNKQFVITSFSNDIDKATSLHEVELGPIGEKQVLVKNYYVGINALYDREMYKGQVPYINVTFPYVFGVESVGVIVDVGTQVDKTHIGQAVSILKVGTAYQEYQVVDAETLVFVPEASKEYLTINPTGVSAYLALNCLVDVKKGDTVVVSAAAGGLGHILVQLCHILGAHVVAICGGQNKKVFLEKIGSCHRIIDYKSESVLEVLSTEYKNKINVAFDSVGRHMFDNMLAHLAPLGRLIVIGLAAELSDNRFEVKPQSRVYETLYWKGAGVLCFMNHLFKDQHPQARSILNKMYQDGELQVKVDETVFLGIESIKDASKYLLEGRSCGKVVVKL